MPDAAPNALLDALAGPIAPVPRPKGYTLAAWGVAAGMVGLPLVYLGLIGLAVWGVVWYAGTGLALFDGGIGLATGLLYLGPLVAGAVVVLFLVKPLFAPRKQPSAPLPLDRAEQPLLYAAVDRLADTVGAPRPRRIDVDTQPNASARFRRGVLSMAGDDLVLTVGLPLVGALSMRQLLGVIAHELGHFTQGGGMRLTYLVERISHWFARVAFERDQWDDALARAGENANSFTGLVVLLSALGVGLSRWVLRGLMRVGQGLSRGMLRRMEFDADRYEVRVAGLDAFRATTGDLAALGVAGQQVYSGLYRSLRERRLPYDLPALVLDAESELTAADRAALRASTEALRTDALGTHPAPAERIARAEAEGGPGLPVPEGPARALLQDFEGLSRRATEAFYQAALDDEARTAERVRTSEARADHAEARAAQRALHRYVQGAFSAFAPTLGTLPPPPADPETALKAARDHVLELGPQARTHTEALAELQSQIVGANQAMALAKTLTRFDPGTFGVPGESRDAIAEHGRGLRRRETNRRAQLAPFEAAVRDRLAAALALPAAADHPTVADGRFARWREALQVLEAHAEAVQALHVCLAQALAVNDALRVNPTSTALDHAFEHHMSRLLRQYAALRRALAEIPYPFEHADPAMNVGRFAAERMPTPDNPAGIVEATLQMLGELDDLRARLWAHLARTAEALEETLGLDPLPEVPAGPPEPVMA